MRLSAALVLALQYSITGGEHLHIRAACHSMMVTSVFQQIQVVMLAASGCAKYPPSPVVVYLVVYDSNRHSEDKRLTARERA